MWERACPPTARLYPSLVNFADEVIFVSGGSTLKIYEWYETVDRYSIKEDKWSTAPNLNHARNGHSSCVLGDTIFTFCGYNGDSDFLSSIESLNARALIDGFISPEPEWILV